MCLLKDHAQKSSLFYRMNNVCCSYKEYVCCIKTCIERRYCHYINICFPYIQQCVCCHKASNILFHALQQNTLLIWDPHRGCTTLWSWLKFGWARRETSSAWWPVKLFPNVNSYFFGYFDPINTFFDNIKKKSGRPKQYFGWNGDTVDDPNNRTTNQSIHGYIRAVLLISEINKLLFGYFDPEKICFQIMRIPNFWGDQTGVSALTEALHPRRFVILGDKILQWISSGHAHLWLLQAPN